MKKGIITFLCLLLTATTALGMVSCGMQVSAGNMMDGMPITPPQKKVEDTAPGAAALTQFALSLADTASDPGQNTLISPLSVAFALAMTANGARGETLAQMEQVLGMSVTELNDFFNTYRYLTETEADGEARLKLADSIWFTDDPSFTVNEDFLQINADSFGADVYSAPFDNSTLRDINNWVKSKTDKMIPKILDSISRDSVMYLVNALAFDAEWATPYKESDVRSGSFRTAWGQNKTVEFLHGTEFGYLEDENATGFIKYYQGNRYAFVALLPNEEMTPEEYLGTLDAGSLSDMLAHPQNDWVRTVMPKFTTTSDANLAGILCELGMSDAFDANLADFSGLRTSTGGNIFINRVLHKTYMALNEKGTRAGAATVVEMKTYSTAGDSYGKTVCLDRPFVYLLLDCQTKLPIFIGTMNDPTES